MIKLTALRIRERLIVATAAVCICLATFAAWSQWSTRRGIATTEALFDRANIATQEGLRLRAAVGELRRLESAAMAVGASNANTVQQLRDEWKREAAGIDKVAAKLAADGAELAGLGKDLHANLAAYIAGIDPILQRMQDAQLDGPAALAYAQAQSSKVQALIASTAAVVKAKESGMAAIRAEMASAAMGQAWLQMGVIGLTLLVFLPLMLMTLRSIVLPLRTAVDAAERIAGGDLGGADLGRDAAQDETGQLLRALARMQAALGELVGQVRLSADSIRIASSEVAGGNQDLSQRTEQTASNLQRTASSMEQLAGTVGQSASAAREATQLAVSAAEVATRGGQVVAEVVTTMDEIHQSSRRIADISGVIDGIAFQTNILALNAAVEAARAGEQGRGFAVVAGEVRLLAQRSAAAAKEIKQLIDASAGRVQRGAELVGNAGRTMDEIVGSVQRVSAMIGEISIAAGEQSGGIGEISSAVATLDRMTQQNAALVEQSAAAAESLAQQAGTLTSLVSTFRLDARDAHAPLREQDAARILAPEH